MSNNGGSTGTITWTPTSEVKEKLQLLIDDLIASLNVNELGATENEIKTAVLIAADIMKMSTLFYGNEFDLEAFKKLLRGE